MPVEPIFLPMILPLVALVAAFYLRLRYRIVVDRQLPHRTLSFSSTVIGAAAVGYLVGLILGISLACGVLDWGGNLCGLAGFFVVGPIASAIAIVVAALRMTKFARTDTE